MSGSPVINQLLCTEKQSNKMGFRFCLVSQDNINSNITVNIILTITVTSQTPQASKYVSSKLNLKLESGKITRLLINVFWIEGN